METQVVMKRELFGKEISQQSKTEFLSATELVSAGNVWRLTNDKPLFSFTTWLSYPSTKQFIKQLEEEYGTAIVRSKGRGYHTWVHPFLFIKLALAIDTALEIKVYKWLYDHLLEYRNASGDSYRKMAGALYEAIPNKIKFPKFIKDTANKIRTSVGVANWQEASEEDLKKRDKIQENIALLSGLLPLDKAVEIGIDKALESNSIL